VTGLVGAAGGVGGFLLPFALGSLRGSTGGYAAGFAILTGVAVVGALAVVRRQRVWREAWRMEVAV